MSRSLAERPGRSLARAAALGALHGPAELLPISSSAHIVLVPWLLGRSGPAPAPELRKGLEVALHVGTAAGLAVAWRDDELVRRPGLMALATLPPALAGATLAAPIERRLGTPATISAGLVVGSLGLALATRRDGRRLAVDAGAADALWLGLGQVCALAPGVSRAAATLSVARARGFAPGEAWRLSRAAGVPVSLAAGAWQARRLARAGTARAARPALAVGAGCAFGSALAAARLPPPRRLAPLVAYRLALATLAIRRIRLNPRR